jgi:anti-anti-sigma factor
LGYKCGSKARFANGRHAPAGQLRPSQAVVLPSVFPHADNQGKHMELEIKNLSDQITYLGLRGRLDTTGVGEVELKFTGHTVPSGKPLLLDMSEITYVSSLGLWMLLTVAKALSLRGAKTVLLRPQPSVREILSVSGFDQLMTVHDDEATALEFLAQAKGR